MWANYPGPDGAAELQITNPGGGILGGDLLELEVKLEPHASARVSTQGASKAYRGAASSQRASFEVCAGARLEYLPHHLIPFANSSHSQSTEFRLHGDASMIAWEAFSAGRIARGERFAFDSLRSRTRLLRDRRLEATDGFNLPGGGEHFGGYSYLGNAFIVTPAAAPSLAARLQELLHRGDYRQETLAAASAPGDSLCVVRVLSRTAEGLYSALSQTLELFRHLG